MNDNDEVRDDHDERGDDHPSYYLPDPDPEVCEMCDGHGEKCRMTMDGWDCIPCPACCP